MFCFIFFIYLIYSILYKIMISWSLILFSSIVLNLKTGVALAVKLLFVFLNILYFLYNISSTSAKVFVFKHLIPSLNELSIGWKYIHITSSKLILGSSFLIFLFNSLISLSLILNWYFRYVISSFNFLISLFSIWLFLIPPKTLENFAKSSLSFAFSFFRLSFSLLHSLYFFLYFSISFFNLLISLFWILLIWLIFSFNFLFSSSNFLFFSISNSNFCSNSKLTLISAFFCFLTCILLELLFGGIVSFL